MESENKKAYWIATKGFTVKIMLLWAIFGYLPTIIFVEQLNAFSLGGLPLGFWFAQNGSIFAFMLLVLWYAKGMQKLDEKFDVHE